MGDEKRDGFEASGMGFESNAFEALERDFQDVLHELVGDKSLERFRIEYEKLHRALKKSHESEKRLIKKCRELNQEIVANAAKVQTALKLSQEDQNTISSLKREIEKAWKMVDAAHEKEARAKETIQQLKHEIHNLSRLVEQGAGLSIGQENTVNELMKVKDELTRERDSQIAQISSFKDEIQDYLNKMQLMHVDKKEIDDEISTLKQVVVIRQTDTEKENKKKEKLEKDLKELKQSLETRQHDIKSKQAEILKNQEQQTKLEHAVREEKGKTDKASKEWESLNQRVTKLSQELEEHVHTNAQLLAESAQRQVELRMKDEEILSIRADVSKMSRLREALQKKVQLMEDGQTEVEKGRESLKGNIGDLEKVLDEHKKEREGDRKVMDDLIRERDILNKNLVKAGTATDKQMDIVKIVENTRKNLEQEIAGYKSEAQKQRKIIFQLERERIKYGQEAGDAAARYAQALEAVKGREITITELQRKIADSETKLKQQQNLYEAVRSDRNLYSKNLIEAQEEIADMKRRFKINNHQIEQLKEEIHAKDQALVQEHFDHMRVDKEKEALKLEKDKVSKQIEAAEETITQYKGMVAELNHVINQADQERLRQKKEEDIVTNERDILGTQLIRRNDELSLLYEKIKIQSSTLKKGERQYNERLEDVRILKQNIWQLQTELTELKGQVANLDSLKKEVYQLQRDLLQERTKVKALSEELENPMNVHRWRKLEGSDPATYEMIQKIHTLQKRLIDKTEEVVEKELIIHEKEKLYVELKNILARQPGPEVAEQLAIYQENLSTKTKQMRQMKQELGMYQAQVSEYKYEIGRITGELNEVKVKFFDQKKKEQHRSERDQAQRTHPQEMAAQESRAAIPRFTGGGFSLQTPG